MLDLREGVAELFAEAQNLAIERFVSDNGWRIFHRGVPCSSCGLTDFYHRFGCRPALPIAPTISLAEQWQAEETRKAKERAQRRSLGH